MILAASLFSQRLSSTKTRIKTNNLLYILDLLVTSETKFH